MPVDSTAVPVMGGSPRGRATKPKRNATCNLTMRKTVSAPGFVLVFMSNSVLTENAGMASKAFATTMLMKTANAATITATVLEMLNRYRGPGDPLNEDSELGSTSKGR
ncbi:hypothetical protein B0H11DRAFT_1928330 [Mycena galericulata]|nr:hypothetical protein B0H11DRAFT_1928330 [Mycena galericulata]